MMEAEIRVMQLETKEQHSSLANHQELGRHKGSSGRFQKKRGPADTLTLGSWPPAPGDNTLLLF